jgi:hypothetical protein
MGHINITHGITYLYMSPTFSMKADYTLRPAVGEVVVKLTRVVARFTGRRRYAEQHTKP